MRISVADGCANGFDKWCNMHDSGRGDHDRASVADIVVADRDVDQGDTSRTV